MDCSPPDSSVCGILQARILEWVALLSSRVSCHPRDWTHVSYVSCTGRQVLYHYCSLGSPTIKDTHTHTGLPWWLRRLRIHLQCRGCRRQGFSPWVRKIHWRRAWRPKLPDSCLENPHGQRSLVGYSPWVSRRVWHNWSDWAYIHTYIYIYIYFFFPQFLARSY